MGRITDTRIVDEDIQTALALENLFGHHAPPVFIRHVVPDKARALTQLACIGLALGGSVGQNHAAALFDEQLGDRSPYSGCSTSDDRHFVAKSCHPGRFSFSIGLYRDEGFAADDLPHAFSRSEEHTSELQSLMRISSAVFCLK